MSKIAKSADVSTFQELCSTSNNSETKHPIVMVLLCFLHVQPVLSDFEIRLLQI